MKLQYKSFEIHPSVPFSISRSTTSVYQRVHVRITDEQGVEGWGEAAPNAFYNEDLSTVTTALMKVAQPFLDWSSIDTLDEIAGVEAQMRDLAPDDASARAAVSAALHDLLGKKQGAPVWGLFGLDPMLSPPTSFTIAISTDESELLRRVHDARRYPILKVKLGSDRDEWTVRTVRRAAPDKILRVDANAAWTVDRAIEMVAFLADHGVELLEQPLARDDIPGFQKLSAESPVPIIADESCMTSEDLPKLDGAVHGINIKLSKCGGLAEAHRMAVEARGREMKVMLGCMIESSLGITAMAQIAPLADYADLDGAALVSDDPFRGVTIDDGMIRFPAGAGLGVTSKRP
jgi:L-alanine-DL-glutamate epimerase-like enolase superfamily enzyme